MDNIGKVRSRYPHASAEKESTGEWSVWDITHEERKRLDEAPANWRNQETFMERQLRQLQNTVAQLMPTGRTGHSAYELGFDCGRNGANTTNCHFSIFATPEYSKAWELGKADAEAGREMRQRYEA